MAKFFRRSFKKRRTFRRTRRSYGRRRRGFGRAFRSLGRRYRQRKTTFYVRGKYLMPDQLFARCYYEESLIVTQPAATDPGFEVIRGNDIFDPRVGVSNPSVYGLGTYGGIYNYYCVYASRVRCTFVNQSTQLLYVGILPSSTSNTLSAGVNYTASRPTTLTNQPYCKYKTCTFDNTGGFVNGKVTVTSYMSTSKIFGITSRRVTDDPAFSALTTADPASSFYWFPFLWETTATTTGQCIVNCHVTYYVKFFGRVSDAS